MTGFVPYADVDPCFDNASLHVSTAAGEGFPNTFLQAWARGIPTVSFFDPEAKFDGLAVGVVVPDLDAMTQAVLALKTNSARWGKQGEVSSSTIDATTPWRPSSMTTSVSSINLCR